MGVIELESVGNVRDLGGIAVRGDRVVAPGLFLRGSALHKLTDADASVLFGELGVSCVLDLRTGWEREAKPDRAPSYVEQLHIPFYDLEKVGLEYTRPAKGTVPIGRDIACEPDHYYRSLANPRTVAQMRAGLDATFARAVQGRAVYQHCSGGKDRTGIFALLILTVLGADERAILHDYLLTNAARDKTLEHVHARFLRLADGNEELARELTVAHRARPENLTAFREAVCGAYGSMDAFVRDRLGIDDARREELRRACTRPAQAEERT